MSDLKSESSEKSLVDLVRQEKEVVYALLVQELDGDIDLIDIVRNLRKRMVRSICGISRVFDYENKRKDSSIILFIASRDEYEGLIMKGVIKIKGGKRIKTISHDLIVKMAVNVDEVKNSPINLMITKTFEVIRPLLSDYLTMEFERLLEKVPDPIKITGFIIPFYERKQCSRNFLFISMLDSQSADELISHSVVNWTDGREVKHAFNSPIVVSYSRIEDLKDFSFGKHNKIRLNDEIQQLNFLSTCLQ